jgi:hypothetical protein
VRASERVLFQALDREAVLLHLDSGIYFGLDHVGTEIWGLLPESESLLQVAHAIAGRYQLPEEQSARDLMCLVEEMLKNGLVNVG